MALFTVILEFDGGTYISHFQATSAHNQPNLFLSFATTGCDASLNKRFLPDAKGLVPKTQAVVAPRWVVERCCEL